jgi:hypothetical protein
MPEIEEYIAEGYVAEPGDYVEGDCIIRITDGYGRIMKGDTFIARRVGNRSVVLNYTDTGREVPGSYLRHSFVIKGEDDGA